MTVFYFGGENEEIRFILLRFNGKWIINLVFTS